MRRLFSITSAFVLLPARAFAQQPVTIGDAIVTSSLRSRMYSWDWFGGTPNGLDAYAEALL